MLDTTRIQAITLDLDDTLWPIWPTIQRAEQALAAWLAERAPGAAAVFADQASQVVGSTTGSPLRCRDFRVVASSVREVI